MSEHYSAKEIHPAQTKDAPRVAACANAAFRHYIERIGNLPQPMLADYDELIQQGNVWVIELNEAIVGILVLAITAEGFLLDTVAVDPLHQGQGFGAALIDFAEAQALRADFDSIYLYTHEKMVENRSAYLKIGYAEYDRRNENGYSRVYLRKSLV